MPELPEVETIKGQLEQILPFKVLDQERSDVFDSLLRKDDKKTPFKIQNKTIIKIERKGKALRFYFDDGMNLLSHLGMSGSWRISKTEINEKHTHLLLQGTQYFLAYIDPRRFGKIALLTNDQIESRLSKLGVDISEEGFTKEYIKSCLKKSPERKIKPFLLEQKYFAGIGNYIACEILALAGIRPTRQNKNITLNECEKIRISALKVINGQIENNGLTFSGGYADAFGNKGEGVQNLVVFHQKSCGICNKTEVKKIVLAQRGTYYCPNCQK